MKNALTPLLLFVSLISLVSAHCDLCGKTEKKKVDHAHATVGEAAPDFTLKTASGDEVQLSALKGKEVVLEWVNFGCPFVKKHYAKGNMQALQQKYTEQGVVWITISSANENHPTYLNAADLESAAKKAQSNATYTLVDADGAVGHLYEAKTTPHTFVINKEGILSYAGAIDSKKSTNPADIPGATNYVAAALDALLAGQEVATKETRAYGCSVKY